MRFKLIVCLAVGFFISTGVFAQQGQLFSLSGKPISYTAAVAKEKTILFLWTTTCPYCVAGLKQFNKEGFDGYDAQIYLINMGDDLEAVNDLTKRLGLKDFLKEHILADPNLTLSERFTILGVPTIIFLRNGKPIYTAYTIDKDFVKEVYSKK